MAASHKEVYGQGTPGSNGEGGGPAAAPSAHRQNWSWEDSAQLSCSQEEATVASLKVTLLPLPVLPLLLPLPPQFLFSLVVPGHHCSLLTLCLPERGIQLISGSLANIGGFLWSPWTSSPQWVGDRL